MKQGFPNEIEPDFRKTIQASKDPGGGRQQGTS